MELGKVMPVTRIALVAVKQPGKLSMHLCQRQHLKSAQAAILAGAIDSAGPPPVVAMQPAPWTAPQEPPIVPLACSRTR